MTTTVLCNSGSIFRRVVGLVDDSGQLHLCACCALADPGRHIRLAAPDEFGLQDFVRLLPDLLRLLKRLAADLAMPRRRIRVALVRLAAFVASPIDLIPDVIPVIGFADDVILVGLVLRWITRTAGPEAFSKHCAAHQTVLLPYAGYVRCRKRRPNSACV